MEKDKKAQEEIREKVESLVNEEQKKEPKKKDKEEKSTFYKIANIVLWVIAIAWIGVSLTDFIRTYFDKDPIFCIKEEVHKYDDGEVYVCTEFGFKFFDYKRDSYRARQFGAFWTKEYDPTAEKK